VQAFWLLEPEFSASIFIASVIGLVLRGPDDQAATEPPNAEASKEHADIEDGMTYRLPAFAVTAENMACVKSPTASAMIP
jgi:hypothetical protein